MLKLERFIIICVLAATTAWNGYSQSLPKVSISLESQPLSVFLSEIEKQIPYTFTHDNSVSRRAVVSVTARDEKLDDLLTRVLTPLDISYQFSNRHVILKKRAVSTAPTAISGTVTTESGEPVIGAVVEIRGTGTGVTTDVAGRYSITVKDPAAVITVSYLGYVTQTFTAGNRTVINVILKESFNVMDEVIVVGYGVQKRRDIVGAVEQISGEVLENRANPNIARSLQGTMPGVNVSMWDGKPTRASTPVIRGTTNSIGAGGSALVLIDGVEGNLSDINPADVENVSVLKDASSAAVYGARGAFGVILVTTRNAAKGEVRVNYNGNFSFKRRTAIPELVTNGLQWTNMYLESWQTANSTTAYPTTIDVAFPFSESWYEELKKRDADPTLEKTALSDNGLWQYYGNTNWYDEYYKDFNTATEHSLSVSGGNETTNFYISGRYYNQDGIYRVGSEDYKTYNMRAKGQIKIYDWLTIEDNFSFVRSDYHQPMIMYDNNLVPRQISRQGYPMTMVKNPDGTWTDAAVYTGYAGFAEGTSWQENANFNMKNTIALNITPVKDRFNIRADFSYSYTHLDIDRLTNQYTGYTGPTTTVTRHSYSQMNNWNRNTTYLSSNIVGNFTPDLGTDHTLSVMAGWNIEDRLYTNQRTTRRGVLYPGRPSFTLMDGDYYLTEKGGNSWGFVGFFGRVNYNYKGKYLAEISGRYDGSSKFPANQQWGLFPSASVGWRLSEEEFMDGAEGWLDNAKIRASVGALGNGQIDPYKYQELMSIEKTKYLFNGQQESFTHVPAIVPDGLTWEKAITYDIGLDLDMFDNRLSFVGDYYWKYTSDMYTVGPTLPDVLGSGAPKGNYAEMKTHGWELSLSWRDSFTLGGKPFSYNVKAMLWDSRSWITKYYNATGSIANINYNKAYYEGMELGEIWGFRVDGLFADQYDIDTHADQSYFRISNSTANWMPGDMKFRDLDGSGIIDKGAETLSDHGDLEIIGNNTPRYHYGINLGANWNGVGLSVFLQGIGKRDWYPATESALFWGQYGRSYETALKVHQANRYTDENKDTGAYWPRYRGYQAVWAAGQLSTANDRYLQNTAYLRVKNITVDYTFPQKISSRMGMKTLKVYLSGENLFTFSKLFKVTRNFDPEGINPGDSDWNSTLGNDKSGEGYGYPILKSITFGLNITF